MEIINSTEWRNTSFTNVSELRPCNGTYGIYTCYDEDASDADDAIWIISCCFIIFTMQSGFGLLESGSVTQKNEVNIMVKNVVDVVCGGLSYWIFGYGLSFGEDPGTNGFTGWGHFCVSSTDPRIMGQLYAKFFFQASFATTATTIVSGAMAERTRLESYTIFSLLNTLVYCFPAHWVWAPSGWLHQLGMVDIAGAGAVHLCGGITGLVATIMLKPRHNRYQSKYPPPMGSPTNALLGTFMLWWGWLGFNCGSTFGVSGYKWKLAARAATTTLISSIAGGMTGITASYLFKNRKFDVATIINGILGSLVSITAFCALAQPWEAIVIGTIGGMIALASVSLMDYLHIDDPVGCVSVHAVAGVWSLLNVGLFMRPDQLVTELGLFHHSKGVFYGGEWRLLGVQLAGALAIIAWSAVSAFVLLLLIDKTIGLRVPLQQEILGADMVEHSVGLVAYNKRKGVVVGLKRTSSMNSIDEDVGVTVMSDVRFNGARLQRRESQADHSLNAVSRILHPSSTNGHAAPPSGEAHKLIDVQAIIRSRQRARQKSEISKTMWHYAAGKLLNKDEKLRREKVRMNISFLRRRRKSMKSKGAAISEGAAVGQGPVLKEIKPVEVSSRSAATKTSSSSSNDTLTQSIFTSSHSQEDHISIQTEDNKHTVSAMSRNEQTSVTVSSCDHTLAVLPTRTNHSWRLSSRSSDRTITLSEGSNLPHGSKTNDMAGCDNPCFDDAGEGDNSKSNGTNPADDAYFSPREGITMVDSITGAGGDFQEGSTGRSEDRGEDLHEVVVKGAPCSAELIITHM